MPTKPQTSKEYFTVLAVLHGAMFMTQVLFAVVAYYLISTGQFATSKDLNDIFKIVAPVFVLAGFLGSSFLSKAQLKLIKQKSILPDKLKDYRTALLIKWALLEMPSMFSLVCFLLTGNYFFLGLAALVMVLFFFNRPTVDSASVDLELNPSDKKFVENPNSVVTEVNQVE